MLSKSLFYILLQRIWQGLAGIITIFFVANTLTPDQQGWYYTFISIAALYSIFEMGLSAALINFSAQMFVKLHWLGGGRVGGQEVLEFKSFFLSSFRIYSLISLLFITLALIVGIGVFHHRSNVDIDIAVWMTPWVTLVVFTAFNLLTLPFMAVVEGSGEIEEVYKVRLIQGILGSFVTWLLLGMGCWLWATVAMPLACIFVTVCWIKCKRRGLAHILMNPVEIKRFDWKAKIWPHQWRLGLSWVSIFFMSQLATPILFYYCDPIVAGRMGLSLTIVHMLGIVSQSWIARRVPMMSQAVVRREWDILDNLFRRDFLKSLIIFFIGALTLIGCYQVFLDTEYIKRVLPFWQFLGLLGFVFFYHCNGALSAQLRSYRREPLVWVFVVGSLMIVIGSAIAASSYSVGSVVLVMLGVQALFISPFSFLLWRRYNKILRTNASVL
jgi:hypothetical protein